MDALKLDDIFLSDWEEFVRSPAANLYREAIALEKACPIQIDGQLSLGANSEQVLRILYTRAWWTGATSVIRKIY